MQKRDKIGLCQIVTAREKIPLYRGVRARYFVKFAFLCIFIACSRSNTLDEIGSPRYSSEPIQFDEALGLLSSDRSTSCNDIPCLLNESYSQDALARSSALAIYYKVGAVAGTGRRQTISVTQGPKVDLIPQLPTGEYQKSLVWTAQSILWMDRLLDFLDERSASGIAYEWRDMRLAFMRSTSGTRPSGWAEVPFSSRSGLFLNVSGSLVRDKESTKRLLVHELFHWNDLSRGKWSTSALVDDYQLIIDRCGNDTGCLTPFTPTNMRLGGRFYAFNTDHAEPIMELAAEVAVRYFLEQSAVLDKVPLREQWKCNHHVNSRIWNAMIEEFFAGIDLTEDCKIQNRLD